MNLNILNILINVSKARVKSDRIKKEDKKDVVTKGDIEIGNLIIQKALENSERIVVESEEFGKQKNFQGDEKEDYYVAIDDIDGSNNLRVGMNMLPYCSMIVVFKNNTNKSEYRYEDVVAAGCLEHISGRIFYTEKGLGEVCIYDTNGIKIGSSKDNAQDNSGLVQTLSTDIVSSKRGGATGYGKCQSKQSKIDIIPDELGSVYSEYAITDSGCSVFEYALVGSGIRDGYISKGKKQHELPLLYAFCRETGKEMVDFDGKKYDEKVYDFSGKNASVIASDEKTIEKCLELIQKQKKVNEKILICLSEDKNFDAPKTLQGEER